MTTLSEHAILIVTHNHEKYIENLINSCKEIPEIEKFICDAASKDGTFELLESLTRGRNDFHCLRRSELEGFSSNNNYLIKKFSIRKNILLINPDCYFTRESILRFLAKASHHPQAGVIAPTLTYPDERQQISWRKFPNITSFLKKRFGRTPSPQKNHTIVKITDGVFRIEWALGAFLFLSKSLLCDGKILDERYRLYCEDADICFNSHAQGKDVIGIETSGIYHALQEKSTDVFSKYNYWNASSGLKFLLKWNLRYNSILKNIRNQTQLR
ncbi:Rhamnosyltransferase WbbL [compost metagenome]